VGKGQLIVSGRVARPSTLRLTLRRPAGGPLVTVVAPVLAGRFTLRPRLAAELLPRGALVLPGAFVVSLTGRSGGKPVLLQLRAVMLGAPAEGVVRRAFQTDSEDGPPATSVPYGPTQIWAHYLFAAQPQAGRKLTVTWYRPDGRLIGTIPKPNRPVVWSWLRSNYPIPRGIWRAELHAGGRLVKVLGVRVV
jgi:hypothetical protein